MSFAPHIRRRHLLSGQRWRMRLVFWGGALAVGLVSGLPGLPTAPPNYSIIS